MATPQAHVAAVRGAVAHWWNKPYTKATFVSKVGRYAPGPVVTLLPDVNHALSSLVGFKRGLTVQEWKAISLTSLVRDVYLLSAKCF
ncbi:hypothetical protein IAE60_13130 [Pseudoxanthomonas mexicana]|uniref:Uncharacterized protein n=1 Tax=Pseudoxanthomonas mexicana TaxID=128785 RepID=A0A7G9T9V4_PSEMX|nr:hypothetical protein [Pseudoxanthomonas mexicana]QNN76879.1 hypothetical protein IAE60_13130 [Pseudoxanthomonas mexicana]